MKHRAFAPGGFGPDAVDAPVEPFGERAQEGDVVIVGGVEGQREQQAGVQAFRRLVQGASFAAGLVPGARIARRLGGASFDLGRRANGQFAKNWVGKQLAQDIGTKGLQSQATGKTLDAVRCAR